MRTYLLILLSCCLALQANGQTFSQPKQAPVKNKLNTPAVSLTPRQQSWLKGNYRELSALPKESAAEKVRQENPGISESSIEYLLSQAASLMKNDQAQESQRLQLLKQQLSTVKQQIKSKEAALQKTTDPAKRSALEAELAALRAKQEDLEAKIAALEP